MTMTHASWRKCDFQIHSCRDPNWSGSRPVGQGDALHGGALATAADVDSQRAEWAKQFIDACIARGLQAIALTDHHEMVMMPYVRDEIASRKTADAAFDLWLFPGMELTALNGVQCIILFDADLSDDWLQQAQGKLGIVYADLDDKSPKAPKVTQLTCAYPDIGTELDKIEKLRGKFIVLPNVSQGGKHTVLKDGAHADFRRMSYVGAYLDSGQTLDTLSSGNRTRLSGTDRTWSEKEIYPLPTSDSRTGDFSKLGTNNAWIKLATPTAEAIRQAFLAYRSRVTTQPPNLPSIKVASLRLSGSSTLAPATVTFSPELVSVIGGRGCGKSSLLEYIAFGLGRSCYDMPREAYSGTKRLHDLINDTLISQGGSIQLTVIQDNAAFEITRGPGTAYQPQVRYPNGTTQTITVRDLRQLFTGNVFSQGELAEIGKLASEKTELTDLLQFVSPDYKKENDELTAQIEDARDAVKAAVQRQADSWELQAELRKRVAERDALKERVSALEKTLPTLSPEDQAKVDRFQGTSDFEASRSQASKHADQAVTAVEALAKELGVKRELPNQADAEAQDFDKAYAEFYHDLTANLAALTSSLTSKRSALRAAAAKWATVAQNARLDRDGALAKLSEHQVATANIIKLREEIATANDVIADLEARKRTIGDPSAELVSAIASLREAVDRHAQRTMQWATEVETLSSGKIKASVLPAGDLSGTKDALDALTARTGSQEAARFEALRTAIAAEGVWETLNKLRAECLAVLYWRHLGAASGEEQPKCADLFKVVGTTPKIRTATFDMMSAERIAAIAAAIPKPAISLAYTDGATSLAFEKASEGQRASALLFMLLQQEGGPLLIDQPEGDLDNSIISELTETLHAAKQKRQILFASHNANIVVNGSSELVTHLRVNANGQREFERVGAIDDPDIRQIITTTMEGGEKAFKDRLQKYGF